MAYQILCIGPPGLLGFSMHLATGAFDPGRGYTSPPGLEPHVVDLPQRSGLFREKTTQRRKGAKTQR